LACLATGVPTPATSNFFNRTRHPASALCQRSCWVRHEVWHTRGTHGCAKEKDPANTTFYEVFLTKRRTRDSNPRTQFRKLLMTKNLRSRLLKWQGIGRKTGAVDVSCWQQVTLICSLLFQRGRICLTRFEQPSSLCVGESTKVSIDHLSFSCVSSLAQGCVDLLRLGDSKRRYRVRVLSIRCSGRRGRWFESSRPDLKSKQLVAFICGELCLVWCQ
jgi:hypothetical protein